MAKTWLVDGIPEKNCYIQEDGNQYHAYSVPFESGVPYTKGAWYPSIEEALKDYFGEHAKILHEVNY